MSDNIPITPGSGATLGADSVGGVLYVVDKVAFGPDGALTRVQSTPGAGLPIEGVTGGNPVPVSGTIICSAGTSLNTSALALENGGHLASIDSKVPALGQALAAGSVPVVLTAAQLAALAPLSTVAITAAALPLPSGAATAAKQPALGTAGTASTDVITVQGIAGGVAQPVSAATLPLPAGAAQDGTDGTGITPPTGAVGIRGWLSGIFHLLSNALAVTQSGTWSMNQGTGGSSAWKVDGSAVTQPVSGTVTVNAGSGTLEVSAASLPLPTGAAQDGSDATGVTPMTGGVGIRGFLSSIYAKLASSIAVTQSGTFTVQPGNTANTTAWKVDGSAVTQPISGTITANAGTNLNTSLLALEGGNLASLNTKTPALGQALSAASVPVVLTAAQLSALTPLTSVGINGTVPISASALPLPTNAAQEGGGNLATLAGAVTSNQMNIAATALPLPTGAAADGVDGTAITPPAGGSGIRGWLSGIYSKLSGTLTVSGTFWQTTQPVSGSGTFTVAGNIASGAADSGNPVKAGGVYNSSAPMLTTGQRGDLQLDANGNLKVNVEVGGGGGGGGSNAAASATGSAVPADAGYTGLNKAGNLVGQTAVTPSGSIVAAQVDLASIGGASLAFGQGTMAASIPVVLASNQSAHPVSQSGSWSVVLGAGSAAIGSITNTSFGATQSGSWSVSLAAGSAAIGSITNTTFAVTNVGTFAVQAAQSGSWNVGQTGSWSVALAAGSNAIGSITNTTFAVTNVGTFAVQAAQSGTWNLGTVTAVTAITNALPSGSNTIGKVTVNTATTGGATPAVWVSAASTNATNVKSSAGTLYSIQVGNSTGSDAYLKIYDTSGTPVPGTDTPVKVIYIPAGAGNNPHFTTQGIAFASGLGFALTANPALSDATAVGANIVLSIDYA